MAPAIFAYASRSAKSSGIVELRYYRRGATSRPSARDAMASALRSKLCHAMAFATTPLQALSSARAVVLEDGSRKGGGSREMAGEPRIGE